MGRTGRTDTLVDNNGHVCNKLKKRRLIRERLSTLRCIFPKGYGSSFPSTHCIVNRWQTMWQLLLEVMSVLSLSIRGILDLITSSSFQLW